ncbi:MAG: cytochrome c [Ignavibacteriales bacterium]|nr:MAG: cytochrome c [Ignavibacteriales bacterium]
MTKPQIWIATFLALFILLFLLSRLTKEAETNQTTPPVESPVPQTNLSSGDLSAKELITKLGCITCHGNDLQGTRMGPALYNVSEYWSRDKLINYLRNPSSYADTERYQKLKQQYPGMIMPSFSNIEVKELGKIADYLLELK